MRMTPKRRRPMLATLVRPSTAARARSEDGVTGVHARTSAEVEAALLELIDDAPRRERIGQQAYEDVKAHRRIEVVAEAWRDVLTEEELATWKKCVAKHLPADGATWMERVATEALEKTRTKKRPRRDLNPCYRRERPVSWARLDDGDDAKKRPNRSSRA